LAVAKAPKYCLRLNPHLSILGDLIKDLSFISHHQVVEIGVIGLLLLLLLRRRHHDPAGVDGAAPHRQDQL
jgi:hypothetical protein